MNFVVDEFCCLTICECWKNKRYELIDTVKKLIENFCVLNHIVQFYEIISSKSLELIFTLGKFLNIIIKFDRNA